MKRIALVFLSLVLLGGCTTLSPMALEDPGEQCELIVTLEVVKVANEYLTNELDIHQNKMELDCRRVAIREEWIRLREGILLLFTYETWECYDCPE